MTMTSTPAWTTEKPTALLVLGVVGAAVAVVRIVRVDPLVALGDNR